MIILKVIEKFHKDRIESIKKMSNGYEKDLAIGALVADLVKKSITPVAKAIGSCFRKTKKCYQMFVDGCIQLKIEFRGRKRITAKYTNHKKDIEKIIENYKIIDSHFKTETLSIALNPNTIINELILNYNYPSKFACYNTIVNLLYEMSYKYHKTPKSKVIDKGPETNEMSKNNDEFTRYAY